MQWKKPNAEEKAECNRTSHLQRKNAECNVKKPNAMGKAECNGKTKYNGKS